MRALPARRLASTALCAALLAGVTGPAAVAAPAHERSRATHRAPVPGADVLLGRTRSLGDLAAVLAPVTDLLTAALEADNGQLAPDRAARLAAAARSAITRLTAPTRPAAVAQAKGLGGEPTAKDLTEDALKSLQAAIDTLTKATTSGDAGQVAPAGTAVLTGLADYLAALLLGGALPAPTRAARPALPGLPATVLLPPPSS
ncbi:hypothetical protein ACIRQQ_11615 [Streptomyces fuscichromogenes]|uniref:hypothetical protein n=1 Tax=Streptomyces fuscichromogenes TaxID=1324013 RepID=UPI00380E5E56